jgi:hypothetical protein
MTKEEILAKHCYTAALGNIEEYSNALSAMDEYAKQQAIDFAKWISDNEMEGDGDKLYDQFIESQNKQP